MVNNLSDIVNVQIEIQTPAVSGEDFSTLLLIGPAPALAPAKAPPDVGVYTSLKAVKDAGWLPADGDTPADPIYTAANVAFGQSPQPPKIMIAVRKLRQAAKPIPNPDTDVDPTPEPAAESLFEPIANSLDRALSRTGWYGIAPAGIEESQFQAIADWTEANEKLFGFPLSGTANPMDTSAYMRTFGIYALTGEDGKDETPETTRYAHVAWFCKCFSYTPGSETWNLKTLNLIEPALLSGTEMQDLKEHKLNYYTTYAGKNVTQGGNTLSGEWIDVIRFRDWLKNDMQYRLFNLLYTHPKIPYTDEGIALVQNQMIASLTQGQRQGGIAKDEFDEDGNLIPGFTVTVPLSANLTAADRASRVLKGCKFHARLAGAIHVIDVYGTLAYESEVLS